MTQDAPSMFVGVFHSAKLATSWRKRSIFGASEESNTAPRVSSAPFSPARSRLLSVTVRSVYRKLSRVPLSLSIGLLNEATARLTEVFPDTACSSAKR